MNRIRYNVRMGVLASIADADGAPTVTLGRAYAGNGPGLNNPECEAVRALGPLPRGSYRMHGPMDHPRLGPCVFYLEPLKPKEMFGRSGFFIHGDNALRNFSASAGCIVAERVVRNRLKALMPATLLVE